MPDTFERGGAGAVPENGYKMFPRNAVAVEICPCCGATMTPPVTDPAVVLDAIVAELTQATRSQFADGIARDRAWRKQKWPPENACYLVRPIPGAESAKAIALDPRYRRTHGL